MVPSVFVSYSHDSDKHKEWVLQLATRLRSNGVDAILDRWNLRLGRDVAAFIEKGLTKSRRVLCICSDNYVAKANNKKGGVGYEKRIMAAELMANLNTDCVIPVIRNNSGDELVPTFLKGCLYVDFRNDLLYESKYEELLRALLDEPLIPVPPLGRNPFTTIKQYAKQKFVPSSEKYVSPGPKGQVTFDYSNNNGRYCIGSDEMMFETKWSKSSDYNIQLLTDPASIRTVAVAKDKEKITEVEDARTYDGSSRVRRPRIGQIAVMQNTNGFWAAIKVLSISDDTRGANWDEVKFDYTIQDEWHSFFCSVTSNDWNDRRSLNSCLGVGRILRALPAIGRRCRGTELMMGPFIRVETDFASSLNLMTPALSEKALSEFDMDPLSLIRGPRTRFGPKRGQR